jgi:hypothetical protein
VRRRRPVGFPAELALTGPGPAPGIETSPVPGNGIALARAVGREIQTGMFSDDGITAFTTGHWRGTYSGGELNSPQQFVKLTGQGSVQMPDNIAATAPNIRLARRALSRNRGLAPGV